MGTIGNAPSMRSRFAGGTSHAWIERLFLSAVVAWPILAGIVLGRYADEAVPTSYLARPLVVATLLSVFVAVLSSFTGRWAAAVAAALAAAIALYPLGYFVGLLLLISFVVAKLAAVGGRHWPVALHWQRAVLTLSAVFFLLAAVRAAAYIDRSPPASSTGAVEGRSLYLVLLDGYPRSDTLSQDLGIDNSPFLRQLDERGFDVYEDARSPRGHTELTLNSMLNASAVGVPVESATVEDKRTARRRLDEARLPLLAMDAGYEYVVIDSPIGHVTYSTGRHIRHGGVTDFEERLLAETTLARIVLAAAPHLLTSSLRAHLDDSLSSLIELGSSGQKRIVLAHLLAPHLPALYAQDGSGLPIPPYWPRHQLFGSVIEDLDISLDYYREMYSGHLSTVNRKIVVTIDTMLAGNPDALIVLFSDHGARYSFNAPEEWSRSFLAARTPGHPNLFGESPTTTHILCDLFVAYLDLPCQ